MVRRGQLHRIMIANGVRHHGHRRRGNGFFPGSGQKQADCQEQKEDYASEQKHEVICHHRTWQTLIRIKSYTFVTFRRRALPTTLTELSAIAAAAITGDSSRPKAG